MPNRRSTVERKQQRQTAAYLLICWQRGQKGDQDDLNPWSVVVRPSLSATPRPHAKGWQPAPVVVCRPVPLPLLHLPALLRVCTEVPRGQCPSMQPLSQSLATARLGTSGRETARCSLVRGRCHPALRSSRVSSRPQMSCAMRLCRTRGSGCGAGCSVNPRWGWHH